MARRRVIYQQKEADMAISKELLEILACPKCKGPLRLTAAQDGLDCEACRLRYEIRDDIPIMLIDEAKPLDAVK
jgi:uncharacterized protein YbaR (Trm112 family)